ncbi:unnamed protein product [Allacma fusca]|uniref:Uncharacterized protein n=1 Tax=Allacma fusca TaxID=39272 RepID=A0A8J2P7K1_9HEXA|nr:unnamed protein product [Allacma fusca]
MDSLENVAALPRVARIVGYNQASQETRTVTRAMFVEWSRKLFKLNPWEFSTSFVNSITQDLTLVPTRLSRKAKVCLLKNIFLMDRNHLSREQ